MEEGEIMCGMVLVWTQKFGTCLLYPKFHYADFVTKSGTSLRQSQKFATNQVADFHDLCPRLCRELVPDFVADFPRAL